MAILEKEVPITIVGINVKYYEDLGYDIPKYIDKQGRLKIKQGTKIFIKIEDLQEKSNVKVTKICDENNCGKKIPKQSYADILERRKKGDGKDRCKECGIKYIQQKLKVNAPYERSLEYFAKVNNKEYLLEEFSDKNPISPDKIYKSSNDYYLWNCNICNGEYTMAPNQRISDRNCPYCSGRKVLAGFNDLWTTHPYIAKILSNQKRGYEVSAGMGIKEEFICCNCGNSDLKRIEDVVKHGFGCVVCGDGLSFGEKLMTNIILQLNVEYEPQKVFKWSKRKKYDFYIPSLKCIIETHGRQHYTGSFESYGGNSLEQEMRNDQFKENLATKNGIDYYIIIDCRYSTLEWIRNSILKSKMNSLFDLSNIDWENAHEFACNTTLVKIASDLWNKGNRTPKICEIMKVTNKTVVKLLKQASSLGWCSYDVIKIKREIGINSAKNKKKKIIQLDTNDQFIKEWDSASDAKKELKINNIYTVLNGRQKTAGGFKWIYIEDYNQLIKQQN